MVESGNRGCPGGTKVPSVEIRHFQFCTKRYRHHDGFNVSPVSHGPCTQQNKFCNDAACHEVRGHPVWHHCVPKGAELTSLRGSVPFALTCRFRRLPWPPLSEYHQLLCLCTCKCNQLNGLCYKNGFWHDAWQPLIYFDMDTTGVGANQHSGPASRPCFCHTVQWLLVTGD